MIFRLIIYRTVIISLCDRLILGTEIIENSLFLFLESNLILHVYVYNVLCDLRSRTLIKGTFLKI